MYELIRAGERSYYIECPAKIGVYLAGEGGVYLIDSGNDKDAGRKVRQILERNSWKLLGIVNTHSNADHIGGNQYLQRQTGCRVFAAGTEAEFTRNPLLEPSFLFGGCPPKALRHKFLMAQPSGAEDVTAEGFPAELEIIPLPGHFFDMIGIKTPDGTAFIADCLSSEATLGKYGFPFIYDVAAYLDTLERVKALEAELFVPAHAPATGDIGPLADINRDHVLALGEFVLGLCGEPSCFEDILKRSFDQYGLTLDFQQYVLVGSTLRSILAWHLDAGRCEALFCDNRLLWHKL